jgi:hypothetical protein
MAKDGKNTDLDVLAASLGFQADEGWEVKKKMELIKMAGKPAAEIEAEINTAMMDEAGTAVTTGKSWAEKVIAAEISDTATLSEMEAAVGDWVGGLSGTDPAGRVRIICEQIDRFHGGDADIFKPASTGGRTVAEGERRQRGQSQAVLLQSAALQAGRQLIQNSDMVTGLQAISGARLTATERPGWIVEELTSAVATVSVDENNGRQALIAMIPLLENMGILKKTESASSSPPKYGAGSSEEAISLKVNAARAKQQEIDAEVRKVAEAAKYLEKMAEAQAVYFNGSLKDGRAFAEHCFVTNYGNKPDFQRVVITHSGLVTAVLNDRQLKDRLESGLRTYYGVGGAVEMLGKLLVDPAIREKAVKLLDGVLTADAGGMSRADYGTAGKLDEWRAYVGETLETETAALLVGMWEDAFSRQTVGQGYSSGILSEEDRSRVLGECYQAIGRGEMVNILIKGSGELSGLIRKEMLEFMGKRQEQAQEVIKKAGKRTLKDQEKVDFDLAQKVIVWIKGFSESVRRADDAMLIRRVDYDLARDRQLAQEAMERQGIGETVATAEANILGIEAARGGLTEIAQEMGRVLVWQGVKMDEPTGAGQWLEVDTIKEQGQLKLVIKIREGRRPQDLRQVLRSREDGLAALGREDPKRADLERIIATTKVDLALAEKIQRRLDGTPAEGGKEAVKGIRQILTDMARLKSGTMGVGKSLVIVGDDTFGWGKPIDGISSYPGVLPEKAVDLAAASFKTQVDEVTAREYSGTSGGEDVKRTLEEVTKALREAAVKEDVLPQKMTVEEAAKRLADRKQAAEEIVAGERRRIDKALDELVKTLIQRGGLQALLAQKKLLI